MSELYLTEYNDTPHVVSVVYDSIDSDQSRGLELIRGGLPPDYLDVEMLSESVEVIHLYPGGAKGAA